MNTHSARQLDHRLTTLRNLQMSHDWHVRRRIVWRIETSVYDLRGLELWLSRHTATRNPMEDMPKSSYSSLQEIF